MTIDEIRGNIRYNQNLIDLYNSQIRSIESDIDELERLRQKFTSLQSNFASKQENRRSGLLKFSSNTVNNRIFTSYYSGMQGLLNGSQFNNTYEGLTNARSKITQKINSLLNDINDIENNLSYRKRRKAYWQEQLRRALAGGG